MKEFDMQKIMLIVLIGLSIVVLWMRDKTGLQITVQNAGTKGDIVVITGVTKGLGKALAKQFIQQGWRVQGRGTSAKAIAGLQKEYDKDHAFSVVDVTDNNAVKKWAHQVEATLGAPTILINNAGIINNLAPLWKIPSSEFNNVMAINVNGVFNVLQHFIPIMLQAKKGLIINISSNGGKKGEAEFAPYCASKFAIEGLTQSLAQELPEGLTVVSVDPGGGINTDMLKQIYPENAADYPNPDVWAKKAVPYLMSISAQDNGKSLIIPDLIVLVLSTNIVN